MWLELDSLDWHDDVCSPDCLTRRAHAQRLLVAKLARPRLSEAQLDELATQAWNSLPQQRRQSLDQGDWQGGFLECARMLCDIVEEPTGGQGLAVSTGDGRIPWEHETGRKVVRMRAHLAAWVVARERGISVADCDAIADAALNSGFALLAEWENQRDRSL